MENIRQVVCENMIALRKAHKLTQLELSKKINYSDKAISRWEKGEVLPDYEVLDSLADVYGVNITYFFEKHETVEVKQKNSNASKLLFLYILAGFVVITVATIIYVNLLVWKDINLWTIFVMAVPVTAVVLVYFNQKYAKNRIMRFVLFSIITWTLILSVYLLLIEYNIWPLFIVGAPIQGCIVFTTLLTGGFGDEKSKKEKQSRKKIKENDEKSAETEGE